MTGPQRVNRCSRIESSLVNRSTSRGDGPSNDGTTVSSRATSSAVHRLPLGSVYVATNPRRLGWSMVPRWELLSRRARTGPQSRVVSPPTPDRYSVILPPNWNRGRQILVGVSLCESDLSADDVSHEAEEPRVREISTDGAETRDHVSHQRLVGADFAGYTFRIELGHGRTLVRSDIHDAMQLGPRSVTHATSRG